MLSFGIDALDRHLPESGLGLGCLHEVAAAGPEVEHGAAASLFVAGLAARLEGMVLWVIEQRDLFAPGLASAGLHPDRLIIAEAGKSVLLVMEEGLRHRGLAAVVGEVHGRLNLTASRRLQLTAESGGVTGFTLRRTRKHNDPVLAEANAAVTRWRLSALPSAPPIADAPDVPGLGERAGRWNYCAAGVANPHLGSWRPVMRRVVSVWLKPLQAEPLQSSSTGNGTWTGSKSSPRLPDEMLHHLALWCLRYAPLVASSARGSSAD